MLLLTLVITTSHAATPRLIGCLTTPAGAPADTSLSYTFRNDGYLALVVENPDGSPDGDFGYWVDGAQSTQVPTGTNTWGLYGDPLAAGVPWTEYQFPASAAWGTKNIRLAYATRDGMIPDTDDDTACLYMVTGSVPSRGTNIGSWCWGPTDTTSYSTSFTASTAGRLVATRTSAGASGGGGVSVYVDGDGQLLLTTSDTDNYTPQWAATPMLASGLHTITIAGEDIDFRDNSGTRCVTLSYTSP